MTGVTQRAIEATICHTARRYPAGDDPVSLCFEKDGKRFFVPKVPNGIFYTDDQLAWIEQVLHDFGIDLFPIDPQTG